MSETKTYDISKLPKSIQENIRENFREERSWTPELRALLDPNIEARRTSLPNINQIKIINREYVYYWARWSPKGNDFDNYSKLKYAGFQNATCDPKCTDQDGKCKCDVHPLLAEISNDGTKIAIPPDLILVKARPDVYYGRQKTYLKQAINFTNPTPRGDGMLNSRMNPEERRALDQTSTFVPSVEEMEKISAKATPANSVKQGTPQWDAIVGKGKEK